MDDNISPNLPGPYIVEFIATIVHAFRKKEQLSQMLCVRLNKNFHEVVADSGDDMKIVAFSLFDCAEAEGWVTELILAIYQENSEVHL